MDKLIITYDIKNKRLYEQEQREKWSKETGYKKLSVANNKIHIYDCKKRRCVCNKWLEGSLDFRKTLYQTPQKMLEACVNLKSVCKNCIRQLHLLNDRVKNKNRFLRAKTKQAAPLSEDRNHEMYDYKKILKRMKNNGK